MLGVLLGCAAPERPTAHVVKVASAAGQVAGADQEADPRVDRWFGEDKLQHLTMSFAATTMLYGGSRLLLDPGPALTVAVAGGMGLGVGKEVVDARSGRWFSMKDLAWDAAGVALGLALAERIR